MRFLRNMFQSTTFVVVLAIATTVAMGAGAVWLDQRQHDLPTASAQVAAAPVVTKAPVGLSVLMSGDGATSPDSAESSETAAAGADGPAGADGAPGADGLPGADGAAGADGAEGPAGPEGPQGSVGATGPAGSVGATGAPGPQGSIGATGPAGIGLTPVEHDGGGYEIQSPDGVSYRIHVTNAGIVFEGPTTTQIWSDTSHFQSLLP